LVNFFGDEAYIERINPDHNDKIDEWTETEEEYGHKNVGESDKNLYKKDIPHHTESYGIEQ
jgi:hypothetical protein